MSRREFQFSDDKSNKFWIIELDGNEFTVNFGRIGTNGQTQTKEFASPEAAKKEYDKLIAEKVKKGYKETGGGGGASRAAKGDEDEDEAEDEDEDEGDDEE
jgi:predicted DNA-binding WGR domain protein